MSKKQLGVEDRVQHVWAAIQRLQHERSIVEIAQELGVSRFTAGRMVRRALEDRLVEVVPRLADPIDPGLSRALADRYGLTSALAVLAPSEQEERVRPVVAAVAAKLLGELIAEDDVVGLTSGRTIIEMCALMDDVPTCDVVQLTGVATTEAEEALHAVMTLSRIAKGRMFPLHAPFLPTDAAAAQTIASQPGVKQALQRMNHLDAAVLTIGGWPDSSLLASQLRQQGELADIERQGVVAEIGTTLLDQDGRELQALNGRTIGIATQQLARVPTKVAIGGGAGKRLAVLAALRSGLVDIIVTDARTARFVLDDTAHGRSGA